MCRYATAGELDRRIRGKRETVWLGGKANDSY